MANNKNKNAIILFTREPEPGETKTRLLSYYSPEECVELHCCFLRDIKKEILPICADIFICYTGSGNSELKKIFGDGVAYLEQSGEDLGKRMNNAIESVLDMGYQKAVLFGADIPELKKETVEVAFDRLDSYDCVMGPTTDDGYYLIGMKKAYEELFKIKEYGSGTVLRNTLDNAHGLGLSVELLDAYSDIDTREDIIALYHRLRKQANSSCINTASFLERKSRISIIIPVYNEVKVLPDFLNEIKQLENKVEIIFSDGGSTDGTIELLAGKYKVVNSKKGRAAQLNLGAQESSGDILFFLHCDSFLPSDCINEIRRCMKGAEYGCFGIKFKSRNFFMLTNRIISNFRARYRGIPFGDQGIFIDRELFFKLGMYPKLPIMEDYSFSMKLKELGYKPAWTQHRITTSDRRYGKGTLEILRTEYAMWESRRKFRRGIDVERIADNYKDIR